MNLRPLVPQTSALTGLRYAPTWCAEIEDDPAQHKPLQDQSAASYSESVEIELELCKIGRKKGLNEQNASCSPKNCDILNKLHRHSSCLRNNRKAERMKRRVVLSCAVLGMMAGFYTSSPARADIPTGIASYYWQGQRTANGERFNPEAMTAAHRHLPFGTKVRVTNLKNGRSIVVRINDRGPFIRGRVIDVSRAAARQLGFTQQGLTHVSLAVVR